MYITCGIYRYTDMYTDTYVCVHAHDSTYGTHSSKCTEHTYVCYMYYVVTALVEVHTYVCTYVHALVIMLENCMPKVTQYGYY